MMTKAAHNKKYEQYVKRGIQINSFRGFFSPFQSLSDMRQEIKTPLLVPIVNFTLAVSTLTFSLSKLAETAVNLAVLDIGEAAKANLVFLSSLETSIYYAGSFVIDTLWTLMSLACRALSTVVAGVGGVLGAVAGAVIDCCRSSSDAGAKAAV